MRTAIYCRVSTDDQKCDRQLDELTAHCNRAGWKPVGIWQETASGAKNDRLARREIVNLAKRREIDQILVTELTRWGRSTIDLISSLQELAAYGVSLVALNGFQFDLTTPHGKLLATILSSLAEFERDLLRERVKSGMVAAKARGKKLGRRAGRSNRVKQLTPKVIRFHHEGMSLRAIARHLQLSKSTVEMILKESR
jgi:putative DNA-invertase from lambdoid prophage Rac